MKLTDKGYLIFPKVVPEDLCQAVVTDIFSHIKGLEELNPAGMVEMYHYQSMWNIRQHPAVHEPFANVFGTDKLWVSIDRCNYKPNLKEEYEKSGRIPNDFKGFIHWDININQRPRPFAVQGLVALTDTDEKMGGFQCCSELYRELDEWLQMLPTKKAIYSSFNVGVGGLTGDKLWCWDSVPVAWQHLYKGKTWNVEKVPMKAGDLLIWDSFLPHGNGPNLGKNPRFAQYITMTLPGDDRLGEERMNCWLGNKPPSDWAFPGDPRLIEQSRTYSAELTKLGQGLLGLRMWM